MLWKVWCVLWTNFLVAFVGFYFVKETGCSCWSTCTLGLVQCSHGLTSRPRAIGGRDMLEAQQDLSGYPSNAFSELFYGSQKLRYCTVAISLRSLPWPVLAVPSVGSGDLCHGHEDRIHSPRVEGSRGAGFQENSLVIK